MATPTPIASKNAGLTLKPCSRSGSVWPAIVASHHSRATRLAARTSRWKSTKSAGDTSRRSASWPGLRRDPEHLHQAIDVAQREGAQDEAVDQRQHGGIGGEADRQRQHDDEGEGGLVRQQARGEAEVTPETGHERISWNREGGRGRPPGAMARDEHPAGDAGRLPPVPRGGAEASAGAPLGVMLLGEIAEDGVRGGRGLDQPPEQPFGQARRAAVSHSLHCRQNTADVERKFHRLRNGPATTPEWWRDDSGVRRQNSGIVGRGGRSGWTTPEWSLEDSGVVAGTPESSTVSGADGYDHERAAACRLRAFDLESGVHQLAPDALGRHPVHVVLIPVGRRRRLGARRPEVHDGQAPARLQRGGEGRAHRPRRREVVVDVAHEDRVTGAVGQVGAIGGARHDLDLRPGAAVTLARSALTRSSPSSLA